MHLAFFEKEESHTGCDQLRIRDLRAYSSPLCLLPLGSSTLLWNMDIEDVKDEEERGYFP